MVCGAANTCAKGQRSGVLGRWSSRSFLEDVDSERRAETDGTPLILKICLLNQMNYWTIDPNLIACGPEPQARRKGA